MSSRWRELLTAALVLAAILAVFFSDSLWGDRVLSPADAIFTTPFFAEAKPAGFGNPSNSLISDQVYQFAPWRRYAWESLRQGLLPLWNPYSMSGTPFVATMQSAVFYPINLLLTLIPFPQTFAWSALLRLWIAGIFTFLLARRYRLDFPAALVAAVSFMLSGFLVVWLGHPHTNAAVWLPAMIYLAEMLSQESTTRGRIRLAAWLALVIGIQFTGGHIETSVDMLLALGAYALLRWFQSRHRDEVNWQSILHRLLIPFGLAVAVGAGIAAIQLVPFLEWLPLSSVLSQRSGSFNFINAAFVRNLLTLPLLVFPNLYSNPAWGLTYTSLLPGTNYNEAALYVGVLTLFGAIIALVTRWRAEPLVRVWAFIGCVSLGMALHLPVLDWINQLPIVSLSAAGRLRLVTSMSLCLLAGFGIQTLWDVNPATSQAARRLWRRLSITVIVTGVTLCVSSNAVLPLLKNRILAYGVDLVERGQSGVIQSKDYYLSKVTGVVDGILAAFRPDNLAMYAPALLALATLLAIGWAARRPSTDPHATQWIVVSLVVMDLLTFGRGYNPTVSAGSFYPETSLVPYLQDGGDPHRITSLRRDLTPDIQMFYDLSDVRGIDFPTRWYDQYVTATGDRVAWLDYGVAFGSVNSPLLRALNVTYVIASPATQAAVSSSTGVSRVVEDTGVSLWQLDKPAPRAFMVYEAIVASSDAKAIQVLTEAPEAVYRRVVLSADDGTPPVLPASQSAGPGGSVTSVRYGPMETNWRVTTPEDGYLFNSDAYYPGWRAYVDGQVARLHRANLAFRAIFVPAGQHDITFRYEPTSVILGGVISAVSLAIAAACLLLMGHPPTILPRRRMATP